MTFNPAAWAVDGAIINSELARVQAYAACPDEGIVQLGDLSVIQLTVPGAGVYIQRGSALILNNYLRDDPGGVDQMYTVTNRAAAGGTTEIENWPASNPAAKSYILAVVIGDPQYSQVGHPWMGADDPTPGTEDTFIYVRPTMIEVAAGTTSLDVEYPALPLARIDIPANTTVITNAMIHNLRKLARPRTQLVQDYVSSGGAGNIDGAPTWKRVGPTILTVDIPDWAVKAKIQGFVEGFRLHSTGSGRLTAYVESNAAATPITNVVETSVQAEGDRKSYSVGGVIDVSDLRGTTQKFSIRAQALTGADDNFLRWDVNTGLFLSVYFEEQPIG